MSTRLIYKDIAIGADKGATISTSGAESFTAPDTIINDAETLPAIATLEPNGWGLTHDYKALSGQPLAFWSTERSGADCTFQNEPYIKIKLDALYSATGITIKFAPESMDFCRKVTIFWTRGGADVGFGLYAPTSPVFVANKLVEGFDGIEIWFDGTNLPNRRCKIESILLGVVREFDATELKKLSAIHEVNLISETIPANVLDADIHPSDDIKYIFQRKQPVEAYNGDALIGVYYIEQGKRTGLRDYSITCSDTIGLLNYITQDGGIWINDTPLTDILTAIFGDVVAFEIDEAYASSTLRGYIPAGTMREALQQIAFALGAVVDTSGSKNVKLFPQPTGTAEAIPAQRTYTGGSVNTADTVTEVTVTAYVFFDERPEDGDLSIEHNGVKYRYYTETKHSYNDVVMAGVPEKKVKFDKMYLCHLGNAQARADDIMSYYKRRDTYTVKHVLDGQVPAGRYTALLPWDGGDANGNITKMTITMSGLTASNTELLLDE